MDIETRGEQPYAAVKATVTPEAFGTIADRFPEVMQWLADRELPVLGAPFLRYLRVTGEEFEVEAGIPTIAGVVGDGEVFTSTLPAGQYVVALHEGSPDGLAAVTDRILAKTVRFDRDGDRWGARVETYFTDPAVEPDQSKWATEVAIRLAD
ncbi:GyrI-like small molecule binding domain-containing protein [Lentzea xinjiangensis]|uniref:GyrI-like small molecule binding domain-containing protein n=1 Tax=Lentzea xinjiangensis TaxID=402600 RepID=A0A1H9G2W4_9PSEU|nr:GyrI-like domain-containing protein [Lentzea xinjiangensis]SEQ44410.1 GyrI-like small molecule binding domain-containing protein [Lentzea xinjiangensis]